MTNKEAFEAWFAYMKKKKPGVLATVLQTRTANRSVANGRLFIPKGSPPIGTLGNLLLDKEIIEIANKKLAEKNPRSETRLSTLSNGAEVHVFIDVYKPQPEIIIFGAGHDAIPVAQFCDSLGFRTSVVDQRTFYNSKERFPAANRIIAQACEYPEKVNIKENSYIIVMNHHLDKDKDTLKFVLNSLAPYIGVLGPRSRFIRILDALKEERIAITYTQLQRFYNPVGLNIGAQSPEEIAISIVSEIIAVRRGNSAGFLKDSEFIHQVLDAK